MLTLRTLTLLSLLDPIFTPHALSAPGETTLSAALLKELVSISSGTADTAGVDHVQERVAEEFKKIGFQTELIKNPDPKITSGKLLVATRKGESNRFITLVGHADTVFQTLNPFQVDETGKIAHGSGVSDNKGGLVVALNALRSMPATQHSIRVMVSPAEETGTHGFHEMMKGFTQDSDLLIGLEPAVDSGNIVTSRKGAHWYYVKIKGKEAHAGVHHDDGVNACDELSLKIAKIRLLTDYKSGNTVSVGHIEGGKDKFNIVCGWAEAKIDVRFSNKKSGDALIKKIEKILNTPLVHSVKGNEPSVTTFTIEEDQVPLTSTPKTAGLLQEYFKIIERIEHRKIQGEASGGAADLNTMTDGKISVVDGLGPIGGFVHTANEQVKLESLKTRAQALQEFLITVDSKIGH